MLIYILYIKHIINMVFIFLILALILIIFFVNKKCTDLNHLTINLFLENRLIAKLIEESAPSHNRSSLKQHLETIEDFFDIKIQIWDPNKNFSQLKIDKEILEFIRSERGAILNNLYSNKLQTKYIVHTNESISKLHIISHKIHNITDEIIMVIQEHSFTSLSHFDLNSSIPIISKMLCMIYAFESIVNEFNEFTT